MLDLTHAFASFPVLHTERFTLRAPVLQDADDVFRILGDPQVTRYFGTLPMKTREEAVRRIASQQRAFDEGTGIRWAIVDRRTGRYLGSCGFWRLVPEHSRAELGYELAPEAWGQGVMTEALAAVLEFGFGGMGLHSVEAHIHPENTGSRRVLEKLGFTREGYFRENYWDVGEERFTDTAVYSLVASSDG